METFTEKERNDIVCALEIAEAQYRKDADIMRIAAKSDDASCNFARLAEQFDRQAERAAHLIEKLL